MANLLKLIVRHTLFSKSGNLTSFDEPYKAIATILNKQKISGIIDAGASNGRISMRLLRLFPEAHVHAFEPNPLYREMLLKLASKDPRLNPQFLALSDKESVVNLNVTRSPGNTSLFTPGNNLKEMYPAESEIEKIEQVEAVTIDRWAERNGNIPVEIMKFDIQGGELKALEGAVHVLQTSTLLVYSEILFNPLYDGGAIYSEIDLFFRKHGFVLYDIYKPRYHRKGNLLWANAVFVHAGRLGL